MKKVSFYIWHGIKLKIVGEVRQRRVHQAHWLAQVSYERWKGTLRDHSTSTNTYAHTVWSQSRAGPGRVRWKDPEGGGGPVGGKGGGGEECVDTRQTIFQPE